uniref:Uncharacterized protein n=1 Tax=Setaria italica TaxID=4555 RepID=K4AP17_SETIT
MHDKENSSSIHGLLNLTLSGTAQRVRWASPSSGPQSVRSSSSQTSSASTRLQTILHSKLL